MGYYKASRELRGLYRDYKVMSTYVLSTAITVVGGMEVKDEARDRSH